MDSANSGSLQSSSGGDEEYDSRPDSLSAAFLHASSASAGGTTTLRPLPPASSSSSPPPFLDSLSYLDPFPRSPNPLLALDAAAVAPWPRSGLPSSSATSAADAARGSAGISINPSPVQPPENPPAAGGGGAAPRGSRKRSRASRRAPTTVLTTDTSNFRAMVQEFTGIPSPPFAAGGATTFPRSGRFDIFHTAAAALRSSSDPPQPHYPLRPFAQKLQSPTFPSSLSSFSPPTTSLVDAIGSTANTISNANANSSIPLTNASSANPNASNSNYQLPPPDLGLGSQSQALLHLQSPLLTFQSLLQSQKYPTTPAAFSARPTMPSDGSGMFGLPPGLVGAEGLQSRGQLTGWADGSSAAEGGGDIGAQLRPVSVANFTGSQQRLSSCKLNYSAASGPSEFHAEKGTSESASVARTEGMVDSWLCSSD